MAPKRPGNRSGNRHRGPFNRPMEHRIAGGHHRKADGCLGAAILIVSVALVGPFAAAYAIVQIVTH